MKIRLPGAAQRFTSSAGHVSPTSASIRMGREGLSSAGRAASTDGGTIIAVTRCRRRSATSAGPGRCSSSVAITSVPPAVRVPQISHTEVSKQSGAVWSTRSPGPTAYVPAWAVGRLARPRCSTRTPLGRPVDPEV
ncbi:MAG: hypothetical protein QM820_26700 [Minicystis sp.]